MFLFVLPLLRLFYAIASPGVATGRDPGLARATVASVPPFCIASAMRFMADGAGCSCPAQLPRRERRRTSPENSP